MLQPPSVKGWDGGRAWINSTSLLTRLRFGLDLIDEDPLATRIPWETLSGDGGPFDAIVARCFPERLDSGTLEQLRTATGATDPRRVLVALLQIPEYQLI